MDGKRLFDRRRFFETTFLEIAKRAVEFSNEGEETVRKMDYLRPPGAVEEPLFISLCTRCDECIKACPHKCIKGANSDTAARHGTPVIMPKEAACRLCSDFPCITACRKGALKAVGDIRGVRMGTAFIDRMRCLDYAEERFSLCQQCYRQCPLPDEAIYLEDSRPVIRTESCIGCGICENVCQTVNPPSAIKVFMINNRR